MAISDLLKYWPDAAAVSACLKTEAEASSEAVSLAVHQRMVFSKRVIGADSSAVTQCDERDLLETFLADDLSEGRVIVPIVGTSGAGKSHVVRWIESQILRMPDPERRVVIRVPKGSSLKGVITLLLEKQELQAPAYERHRQALATARQELDSKEAAGLLCEMLAHTLGEMFDEAKATLLNNPGDRQARERDTYCRPDMLPSLLRNQILRDQHFLRRGGGDGVAKRLVEQLTESRSAGVADDRQHSFTPADLVFDSKIDRDAIGRAEFRALALLDRDDRRETAARILNDALDDAMRDLLRIDPTVSDLFDGIRRDLLTDGRELILLIEDFAVLSGLQKQLLQIIIKEAVRDGRQVLCTMRTALAYTTGYQVPETVLTRAHVEYKIPDEPGTEDEMLLRIERLVGAYLNAARCGQSALERAYERSSSVDAQVDTWVPSYKAAIEPAAVNFLDGFGVSEDGYEFFPFNKSAIHELAREGCLRADRLVYNPRFVIQNIVNRVLSHRDLFEQGAFPPPSFGGIGRPLQSKVAEDIKRRVQSRDLERYFRFLVYWGGYPTEPSEIDNVDGRLFEAFGLTKPSVRPGVASTAAHTKAVKDETPPPPPPPPTQTTDPVEAKWEQLLEKWRTGSQIPQIEANQLRKWIGEALTGLIEWDWDCFKPLNSGALSDPNWFRSGIYIPMAAGHGGITADEAVIAICADGDVRDEAKSAGIQANLMALIRHHGINKGAWDYQGADQDLPRYIGLLEPLVLHARNFATRRYFKSEWNPIPTLFQGLLIGARALGADGADRDNDHGALINAAFLRVAGTDVAVDESGGIDLDSADWVQFVRAVKACRRREHEPQGSQVSWQDHLLSLIGARQGQGGLVYALDLTLLRPALEDLLGHWDFRATLPTAHSGVTEYLSLRTAHAELKKTNNAVTKMRQRLSQWRAAFVPWLGENVDKDALVRDLRETVTAVIAAGATGGSDTKRLLQLIEEFRTAKVMAALDDVRRLDSANARGTILTVLGRGHEPIARMCGELQTRFDEFAKNVDAVFSADSLKYGENPMEAALSDLEFEVTSTTDLLNGLKTL